MLTFVKINFLNLEIMKKIMKSFIAMALGLSLVLAGCSKDDEDGFEGNYSVDVAVTNVPIVGSLDIPTSLHLTKEGVDYKASATLNTYGSLSLLLTSVTEKANAGGVVSYDFTVTEQTLTITGIGDISVSGTGILGSAAGKYTISMGLTAAMDPTTTEDDITVVITGTK
ncbi:MAG: hypothetical protein LBF39_01065 [Prevotellaceae bacterium]|jgi:hypothetical protein|nr:hypothetical protein [Prevotellaceae bacterium]